MDYFKVAENNLKVYRWWWSPPSEGQRKKMAILKYIRGFCWSCHDDKPLHYMYLRIFPAVSQAVESPSGLILYESRHSQPESAKRKKEKMKHSPIRCAVWMPKSDRPAQANVLPASSWCYSPWSSPVPLRSLLQLQSHNSETPTR